MPGLWITMLICALMILPFALDGHSEINND
jgi:hypothetical protein